MTLSKFLNCPGPQFPLCKIGTVIVLPLQERQGFPASWLHVPESHAHLCRGVGGRNCPKITGGRGSWLGVVPERDKDVKCWKTDAKDPICLLFGSGKY